MSTKQSDEKEIRCGDLILYFQKYSWFARFRKQTNIHCHNSQYEYGTRNLGGLLTSLANKNDLITYIEDCKKNNSVVDLKDVETIMNSNHESFDLNSALTSAIKYEMVDLVGYLLDLKKKSTAKPSEQKQTPLHIAAKYGSKNVVEYLITQLKVDKEALDDNGRTALILAAEYNKKDTVKLLIKLGCCISFTEGTRNSESKRDALFDKNGYNALYWIVTKMPDIAVNALDELYRPNLYLRKDDYYLVPLEPKLNGDSIRKSVLMSIIETQNLNLLMHPVILSLIDFKWKKFGRYSAWMDFFFTILYITSWVAFALWKPYNTRYKYDEGLDFFRGSLFIIGIFCTGYYIAIEIAQIYMEYKFQKSINNCRENQLKQEQEEDYTKEEMVMIKKNGLFKVFINYLKDFWNYFDWISILLSLACITSHAVDICNHDELKARVHIRIMSVTIIIIPLRLLKVGRLILPKFGTLVMILYYVVSNILIWFLLFLVIWLPFTCAFWMIYGGVKFEKSVNENNCKDVYNTSYNEEHNCTTLSIDEFKSFDLTAYYLYRVTFGGELNETQMDRIDDTMTNGFVGAYIGFTVLVFLNIFIALLSSSFTRVYEKANAYAFFQRAYEMMQSEIFMGMFQRSFHIKQIGIYGNPYKYTKFELDSSRLEDNLNNLDGKVNYLVEKINYLEYNQRFKFIIRNETTQNENENCENFFRKNQQIDYLLIPTK